MSVQEELAKKEMHLKFAKNANTRVWQLLEKQDRTTDEDVEMILAANAGLYHWMAVGSVENIQRGEWLLAHIYAVLEEKAMAARHTSRCLQLTKTY